MMSKHDYLQRSRNPDCFSLVSGAKMLSSQAELSIYIPMGKLGMTSKVERKILSLIRLR